MPEPLVSIITPAYNAARFIHAAVTSVINQTWKNWELIIVNDGSTDKTLEICQSFCNTDPRIKLITTPNHGVSHARNVGLESASGSYIGFLDADDIIAENYIENLVKALDLTNADVAGAGVVSCDESLSKRLKKNSSSYHGNFAEKLARFDPGVFLAVF